MLRKSLIAGGIALSLVSGSAMAVPARVSAAIGQSESISEDSAWLLPVSALFITALIIAIDGDGGSDRPTSP